VDLLSSGKVEGGRWKVEGGRWKVEGGRSKVFLPLLSSFFLLPPYASLARISDSLRIM